MRRETHTVVHPTCPFGTTWGACDAGFNAWKKEQHELSKARETERLMAKKLDLERRVDEAIARHQEHPSVWTEGRTA